MEIKKTIKYDGKIKDAHFVDGELFNADGESIDLLEILEKVYGEREFTITTTTKTEEILDVNEM